MADRVNRILKVKAKTFSIRKLRELLVECLQTGTYGWECVKNDTSVGGEAIFKVPNYAEGEYGYAIIRYDEIKAGSSYKNWLFKKKNFRKHILYNPEVMNTSNFYLSEIDGKGSCTVYSGNPTLYTWYTKQLFETVYPDPNNQLDFYRLFDDVPQIGWRYKAGMGGATPTKYTIKEAEAFANDADVLFFSMIKQYEEGFEWNDYIDNRRNCPMSRRIAYNTDKNSNLSFWNKPPLYPGEGCPAIGASPDFYSTYAEEEDTIYVYISMTKHNALILVHFREYWDMAQIGFFEPFQSVQEYPFPALSMSSNIGVKPIVKLERVNGADYIHHYFLYDYTHKNMSFGRSMPCTLSTWWDGSKDFVNNHCNSGLQAMSVNGEWVNFAHYGIRNDYYYAMNVGWFDSLKEPELLGDGLLKYTTVYHTDVKKIVETVPFKCVYTNDGLSDETIDEFISYQNTVELSFQPIYMVQCDEKNNNQNMMGTVPATYWCSNKINRYGLFKHEDDLWLLVPNCKEGRKWHYTPFYAYLLGKTQSDESVIAENERIEHLSETMNTAFCLGENEGVVVIGE